MPLGGNRKGRRRALLNLMLVFLLSGLWHGAAWTFVLWGAYHGSFVTLERLLAHRRDFVPRIVQHVTTLALVVIGWVLFRAASAGQAFAMIGAMLGLTSATATEPLPVEALLMPRFALLALVVGGAICLVPIVTKYRERALSWSWIPPGFHALPRVGYLLLFAASAIHLTNMRITPLIYFKF
jgi:alginate O-acetyltransferase complex protein AlgI